MSRQFDFQDLREYGFGIVDATMVEGLPQGLCAEPLVPRRLMQSAHLMPRLIDFRRTPIAQQDLLFDCLSKSFGKSEPPAVALFIKSESIATDIARHWNAMQFAQPRLGRKVWLRLHDPRVLHQLLGILNPVQRRKLIGKSQAFSYWLGGEWVTTMIDLDPLPSAPSSTQRGAELYAGPAKWDWNRIERIGLVNRALHGAGLQDMATLTSASLLAEQLMERAAGSYGLVDHADLVEFATRGLKTHPNFDKHPSVAHLIMRDDRSAEQSSLYDRLALIEERVWNALSESNDTPQESRP
jgi:hypothetical protein